jgi:hypothetical protein
MMHFFRRVVGVAVCVGTLLCASCVTTTMPWTARGGQGPTDKRLVDTWELLYRVVDNGEKQLPTEGTRTLVEFTDKGRWIFNRIDKDNSGLVNNKTGNYTQKDSEIAITDDGSNQVRWTYNVQEDTLVINAPELKTTFYWRRFR